MSDLLAAGALMVGGATALSLIAKATVVTGFAIVAGWLTRRVRAAVRHLIFVAAFMTLALLPAATAILPTLPIPVRLAPMPAMRDVPAPTMAGQPAGGLIVAVEPRAFHDRGDRWPALSIAFGHFAPITIFLSLRRVITLSRRTLITGSTTSTPHTHCAQLNTN